jgi:hypothetical protein
MQGRLRYVRPAAPPATCERTISPPGGMALFRRHVPGGLPSNVQVAARPWRSDGVQPSRFLASLQRSKFPERRLSSLLSSKGGKRPHIFAIEADASELTSRSISSHWLFLLCFLFGLVATRCLQYSFARSSTRVSGFDALSPADPFSATRQSELRCRN